MLLYGKDHSSERHGDHSGSTEDEAKRMCLLAQGQPRLRLDNPELLIATVALMLVLLLAAGIFALLERWKRRQMEESLEEDPLTHYRQLLEAGELSQQEYAKIRSQLAEKYYRIGNSRVSTQDDKDSAPPPPPSAPGSDQNPLDGLPP